jgi:hypothetical protein
MSTALAELKEKDREFGANAREKMEEFFRDALLYEEKGSIAAAAECLDAAVDMENCAMNWERWANM